MESRHSKGVHEPGARQQGEGCERGQSGFVVGLVSTCPCVLSSVLRAFYASYHLTLTSL